MSADTPMHGASDPLFPVPNAHALAAEIPGARLHAFDGVGHEFPANLARRHRCDHRPVGSEW